MDDLLTKVTDLYHLSIKRTEGGGGNPPLSLTRKVKYTPWQIELNYAMFMLNSNKPIKVAYLQKLANESVLNGALVIEMVNNSFIES